MRIVRAARREPVDATPVWFMRQAGRFLPAYRKLRQTHSILEICRDAELSARAGLTAVEAIPDLDAAIVFSDILLLLEPMGIRVEFLPGEGPIIRNPVTDERAVRALRPVDPASDLPGVLGALRILRRAIPSGMALIGFAGAPFTLASYLVQGGPSKDHAAAKGMMHSAPRAWHALMQKLAEAVAAHLRAQIEAGADIVQLFDSWVGALSPDDYREHVLPHSKRIFDALRGGPPAIHFGTGTAGLLELMKEAGGDVIGIDWRIRLDEAWRRLGGDVAVQGNLDPAALLAPRDELIRRVDRVLDAAAGRPGHIFNLGHGILPETPLESVVAVVERVHRRR